MFGHIGPLHNYHGLLVTHDIVQFIGHNARLCQAVKIVVVDHKLGCLVLAADGKARTADGIRTTGAPGQPTDKCRLAATQVAAQLDDFAAPQTRTNISAELFGFVGAVGT